MKQRNTTRNEGRFPVRMRITSEGLPHYQADILDLSEGGAKVKLRATPNTDLKNQRIPFGATIPAQVYAAFEGMARIAWSQQTLDGFEIGLQWENLSAKAKKKLKEALLLAAL